MNLSALFIGRPVATTLLTLAIALAGAVAYFLLPVSPLPQVDIPTILVTAQLPGASPETVSTSLTTPLERHLGQIADVSEITSTSSQGQARIVLQFDLNRNIDGAARDVQAAINAARADLPANLRSNPTYRKVNPASAPVLIMALTSDTLSQGQLYDSAATVLQQKLSQVEGVGQVTIGGSSLPAVRVELNPQILFKYGIGLEDVRAALASANANAPKGAIEFGGRRYQLYTNDQAKQAEQYRSLVIAYRNGAAVRLSDVAQVVDSVEDLRNQGLANGKPSVLLIVYTQPGANIISTVDRIREVLPQLEASLPRDIDLTIVTDRTPSIRASLHDVERALMISVLLVVMVVFFFLRNPRSALIPSVAVPVSLIGTFGAMYLLGYSLDTLSLMALTVATGFVVDDAIVVLENITRHIEAGMPRLQAALLGAREVGFTVVSMSLSLVAVFIPILLMGGIVGRFMREFGMTLSIAVMISLVVSLTTTPMMCAYLIRHRAESEHGRWYRGIGRVFDAVLAFYERTLGWALAHSRVIVGMLLVTIGLNFYLFHIVPKGFIPLEDSGRLVGIIQADQSISFQLMRQKLAQVMAIVQHDPAVANVVGFTGGAQTNSGYVFASLKPLGERTISADRVIDRLRGKLEAVAGARLFLISAQDIRSGGRQTRSQYQYTLQADDVGELYTWTPKITEALQKEPALTDVNSDQEQNGIESDLVIDRATAARFGLKVSQIDNTIYDAFGQRQVSTIYNPLNQYHVIMEVAPEYWQNPKTLEQLYVSTSGGAANGTRTTNAVIGTVSSGANTPAVATAAQIAADSVRNQQLNRLANTTRGNVSAGAAVSTARETMVPLAAVSHYEPGKTPLSINHQGLFVSSTISFNLAAGKSLSDAQSAIDRVIGELHVPADIHGGFQGNAGLFQQSLANEPVLVLAALATIYIVLGILYESYVHPITILSTLPSAGLGAVLALLVCNVEFDLMTLIGILLLIGIVKKNAIMMIDFAVDAERREQLTSRQAIHQACLLRFRPIMMTTLAALLGAVPLVLVGGNGAELRRPLGISIIGGLIVSQILTLYTTPVIYLYLDRLRLWISRRRDARRPRLAEPEPGE